MGNAGMFEDGPTPNAGRGWALETRALVLHADYHLVCK